MPKSRVRKKKVYTPPVELSPQQQMTAASKRPSPVWVPATAVGLVVLGIAWLVLFYSTQGFADVSALSALFKLGYWNLAIGFGALIGALMLFTRWR